MEDTIQTYCKNFYELRSGLSVIAQINDTIESKRKTLDNCDEQLNEMHEELDLIEQEISRLNESIESAPHEINRKKYEAKTFFIKNLLWGALFWLGSALVLSGIACFVYVIFKDVLIGRSPASTNVLKAIVLVVTCITFIACFIGFAIRCFKERKEISYKIRSIKDELNRCTSKLTDRKQKEIASKQKLSQKEPLLNHTKQTIFREITNFHALAKQLWNTLQTKYAPILNIGDWQYLDVLIYDFETGRADSVKEALQLLDRQRQAELIAGEIKNAAEYIGSNLRSVENTMMTGFADIRQEMQNQSGYLEGILSTQFVQTALQQQSVKKSADISKSMTLIEKNVKEVSAKIINS